VPAPRPRPGGSAGKYSGRPSAPSAGPDDPEPVTGLQVHAFGALEDVTGAEPGEQEPAGSNGPHGPDDELTVQQRHRDREAHAEGVDRPRSFEQQRLVGGEARVAEEPARALEMRPGNVHSEPQAPRPDDDEPIHTPTVPLADDGDALEPDSGDAGH